MEWICLVFLLAAIKGEGDSLGVGSKLSALCSPLCSTQTDDFSAEIHFYGPCHKIMSEFINLQDFL